MFVLFVFLFYVLNVSYNDFFKNINYNMLYCGLKFVNGFYDFWIKSIYLNIVYKG